MDVHLKLVTACYGMQKIFENLPQRTSTIKTHFQMFILSLKEPNEFTDYEKVWRFLKKLFYLELFGRFSKTFCML